MLFALLREVLLSMPACTLYELNELPTHYSEPFFDFCIGINGHPLADLGIEFPRGIPSDTKLPNAKWSTVEENEGRTIIINTWNSKHQEYRGASS